MKRCMIILLFCCVFFKIQSVAQMSILENQDLPGSNYKSFEMKSGESCQTCIEACLKDPNCKAFTWTKPGVQAPNGKCWLKSAIPDPVSNSNCISGSNVIYNVPILQEPDTGKPFERIVPEFFRAKPDVKPVKKAGTGKLPEQALQVMMFNPITYLENRDITGNNYKNFAVKPGETCQVCIDSCQKDPNCKAYTYVKPGVQGPDGRCWLKSAAPATVEDKNCISGIKFDIKERTVQFGLNNSIANAEEKDIPGQDYKSFWLNPGETCQTCIDACLKDPNCKAYTYGKPGKHGPNGQCFLKSGASYWTHDMSCISGVKITPRITIEHDLDIPGNNYRNFDLKPGETCQACIDACLNDPECFAYTCIQPGTQGPGGRCFLKSAAPTKVSDKRCISGVKVSRRMSVLYDQNIQGGDYQNFELKEDQDCRDCKDACYNDPDCIAYTCSRNSQGNQTCYLKSLVAQAVQDKNCQSGLKTMVPGGIPVTSALYIYYWGLTDVNELWLVHHNEQNEKVMDLILPDLTEYRYWKCPEGKNMCIPSPENYYHINKKFDLKLLHNPYQDPFPSDYYYFEYRQSRNYFHQLFPQKNSETGGFCLQSNEFGEGWTLLRETMCIFDYDRMPRYRFDQIFRGPDHKIYIYSPGHVMFYPVQLLETVLQSKNYSKYYVPYTLEEFQ